MEDFLFPVFPLNVVLLPGETLPLHIFEERYKQMINECLEAKISRPEEQEFGVVLVDGEKLLPVGCSAHIVEVTQKYPDGRMDILTEGRRRFEILYTNEEKPYLRCGVDFFGDDGGTDTPGEPEALRALDLFRQALQRLRKSSEPAIPAAPPYRHLSFRIASSLPADVKLKQELLSMRQETQRLEKVVNWLKQLIEQVELSEKQVTKARGNGNDLAHIR